MDLEQRTHLVPFVLLGLALGVLPAVSFVLGHDPLGTHLALYGSYGLVMFGCSSLYHLSIIPSDRPQAELMNKLDHLGIHALIAGTGTLHMQVLPAIRDERVPLMTSVLWVLAATGIAYRFHAGDDAKTWFVMPLYVLMAATVIPTIDYGGPLTDPRMLATYAAFLVYGLSAALLFPREHLHAWWHVGTVAGYVLAGLPLVL